MVSEPANSPRARAFAPRRMIPLAALAAAIIAAFALRLDRYLSFEQLAAHRAVEPVHARPVLTHHQLDVGNRLKPGVEIAQMRAQGVEAVFTAGLREDLGRYAA